MSYDVAITLILLVEMKFWRRGSESNRRIRLLQSPALPLGYPAREPIWLAQNRCVWLPRKEIFSPAVHRFPFKQAGRTGRAADQVRLGLACPGLRLKM